MGWQKELFGTGASTQAPPTHTCPSPQPPGSQRGRQMPVTVGWTVWHAVQVAGSVCTAQRAPARAAQSASVVHSAVQVPQWQAVA
jgi:hypothetical protein